VCVVRVRCACVRVSVCVYKCIRACLYVCDCTCACIWCTCKCTCTCMIMFYTVFCDDERDCKWWSERESHAAVSWGV